MGRLLKKFTDGNERNLRLIELRWRHKNPKNTRGSVLYEQNTRANHNAQSYWKHVVSLKSTKAIALNPLVSIITVKSRQLEKVR